MADSLLQLVGSLFPGQSKNTSITAPQDDDPIKPMHDEIKKSGIKATQIDQIFELVASGKVMPGTKEFSDALGIGMEAVGKERERHEPGQHAHAIGVVASYARAADFMQKLHFRTD